MDDEFVGLRSDPDLDNWELRYGLKFVSVSEDGVVSVVVVGFVLPLVVVITLSTDL